MSKADSRTAPRRGRKRLCVVHGPSGWTINGPATGAIRRAYKTQREALVAARKLITDEDGGEVVVHGRDGRIRAVDTYVLGVDSSDKINAVEGIYLSEEMKRDFWALARKRLPPEKRREWLIAKYGSRSDGLRRRK